MLEEERRFDLAVTIRTAMHGEARQMEALRPRRAPAGRRPPATDDYDDSSLADDLAALGFIEEPRP